MENAAGSPATKQIPLPLDGVRVLELGTMITAPYTAMLLAELGASVIKIENPESGDPFRATSSGRYGANFIAYNHGKRSLALDLKSPTGQRAFRKLLEQSDVLVENYRAGVMDKFGFGTDAIRAVNPRLIHCSITGFGSSGPYQDRPAYDAVASALSGIYALAVDPADPKLVGVTISDNVTGMYAANGILGALYERARTGRGRRIEVNMLECAIAFTPDAFAYYTQNKVEYGPSSRIASSQCFAFACADKKLLAIHLSVQSKFWDSFLKVIEAPELATDSRFRDRAGRVARYHELNAELTKIMAKQSRLYWMERLEKADVPFAPINQIPEVLSDPQIQCLGTFGETQHPTEGRIVSIRSPIRVNGERRDNAPPPTLGEHSHEILHELGFANEP
jgi:crotonobetainyl-CoA:carnitine CoA-transferase CaiB-like acyl-CoA transferase